MIAFPFLRAIRAMHCSRSNGSLCDKNVVNAHITKNTRYGPLQDFLHHRLKKPVSIVPVVIGNTGVVPKFATEALRQLECNIPIEWLQKIATIETIKIVKALTSK